MYSRDKAVAVNTHVDRRQFPVTVITHDADLFTSPRASTLVDNNNPFIVVTSAERRAQLSA